MEENNKIPQEIEELRASLNEFMHKQGTVIGFFASKEWEDQTCVAVNGKRESLVNMITNAYFQNESVREILSDVMMMINDVLESEKRSTFQIPIAINNNMKS